MTLETIDALATRVQGCFACSRMDHVHVLGPANGPSGVRLMFIGEAPGRLGAARTGVPFAQDQSGRRFEQLISAAGLRRDEVFVTNALLCNPLRDSRSNRPPATAELRACSRWLAAQIRAVEPPVIVTLGIAALRALDMIEPHPYSLRVNVGVRLPWNGRTLIPLYHPSPRTVAHRPFAQQLADFKSLASLSANTHRR